MMCKNKSILKVVPEAVHEQRENEWEIGKLEQMKMIISCYVRTKECT